MFWRAIVVGVWAVCCESIVRFGVDPPGVPSAGELLLDLIARSACVAVAVSLPALAAAGFLRLPGSPGRAVADLLGRCVSLLCEPWRSARLLLLYAGATIGLRYTAGVGYDRPWNVGVVYGIGVLALAAVTELGVALWRRRGSDERPRSSARAAIAWMVVLTIAGMLHLSRIWGFWRWLDVATLIALFALCPVPPPPPRPWRSPLSVGLASLLVAGLALQVTSPSLRRHVDFYTPISRLGLEALLFATDLDRDGSSGLLGLDCDDLDPSVSPGAEDLPDDGVDQNCTGADTSTARTVERTEPGGPREPWPSSGDVAARPDVILVTVEALKQEAFWERMPKTREWTDSRCVQATRARANATFTDHALLALHTGMHPRHVLRGGDISMGPGRPPTIASTLRSVGYRTRAIITMKPVRPYWTLGFDRVDAPSGWLTHHPPAPSALGPARSLLAEVHDQPLLLWLHLSDTHAPYLGGWSERDYERAVTQLDGTLRTFFEEVAEGRIVVMTADHGEGFGEHGTFGHGQTLFDAEARVPLVICAPPARLPGPARVFETPVAHIDVLPTLADMVGARLSYPIHGESLVPHLTRGAPLRSPWVVAEITRSPFKQQTFVSDCHKWVRDLDQEWEALFDTCADPRETTDLSRTRPDKHAELRAGFLRVLDDDLDAYRSWRFAGRSAL